MDLGLSALTTKHSTKRQGVARAWTDIGGLIGHWDFSDASTMYTTTGGGTNVSSDNDNIGRIMNKVTSDNQFGVSLNASGFPKYKTGGANSKSYGDFDDDCLRCSYNVGNVATSICSYSAVSFQGTAIFFVIDPSDATYSSDKRLFNLCGRDYNLEGLGGFESNSISFGIESDDDEMRAVIYDGGGSSVQDTGIDNTTGAQLWTMAYTATGDLSNCGVLYKDGNGGSPFTIDLSGQDLTINSEIELGKQGPGAQAANQGGVFSIGHQTSSIGGTVGSNWKGKVYEFLVYNVGLTATDRTLIETHLKTKYGIS